MKTSVQFSSNQLSDSVKEQMWAIYHKAYNYDRKSFMDRIPSNNQYAFYYCGEQLIGFTGLRINTIKAGGKENLLIYFGQTIIQKEFRGCSLIPQTGFKLVLKYWRAFMSGRAYFWADALTYKAYLVFAKTLDTCFPSYKQQTPGKEKQLIDAIGKKYYPDSYIAGTGTIYKSAKLVSENCANIRKSDLYDPDICFYAAANPNNSKGHGLITLGPASWKNLVKLTSRYLRAIFGLHKSTNTRKQSTPVYKMAVSMRDTKRQKMFV